MSETGVQSRPVRDCPNCEDGKVALLNYLGVWLCDKDADHAWPADKWPANAGESE